MLLRTTCAVVFASVLFALSNNCVAEEWRQLFNGENLDNWTVKIRHYDVGDNYGDTFRVEDGLMKVSYDKYEKFDARFGHIFYNEEFSHYKLRVEYRIVGEQVPGGAGWALKNSGIMVHGQSAESMSKDQQFPVSLEVQLLGGNGKDPRPTANLCTPGTHVVMDGKLHTPHCTKSSSSTFHGDEWVTVEVEVHGDELIKHYVNGEQVIEYSKPQYDPSYDDTKPLLEGRNGNLKIDRGTISLQSESHPVEFRKVEILVLDEDSATE